MTGSRTILDSYQLIVPGTSTHYNKLLCGLYSFSAQFFAFSSSSNPSTVCRALIPSSCTPVLSTLIYSFLKKASSLCRFPNRTTTCSPLGRSSASSHCCGFPEWLDGLMLLVSVTWGMNRWGEWKCAVVFLIREERMLVIGWSAGGTSQRDEPGILA
jgi:hypothetical protein